MSTYDTEDSMFIVCPYCGLPEDNDDEDVLDVLDELQDGDSTEWFCSNAKCGKRFFAKMHRTITWSTRVTP